MSEQDHNLQILVVSEGADMQEIKDYKTLNNGHIEFTACLQTADEINRNTNCYPKAVLQEALNAERIKELVNRKMWMGEGSHPYARKDFNRSVDIYPKEITHRICQVPYFKGDKIYSIIHTVEPCGKMLASWIVDEGSQIGFSMRGITPYSFTKTTPVNHKIIKAPMNIITYDAVFYPSHRDALMCKTSGVEYTTTHESVYPLNEITKYFTEESTSYKIFKNELGIQIDLTKPIKKYDELNIVATLEDGRIAKYDADMKLMKELSKYIF